MMRSASAMYAIIKSLRFGVREVGQPILLHIRCKKPKVFARRIRVGCCDHGRVTLLERDCGHFPVDIENSTRTRRAPPKKLASASNGVGNAKRDPRFPNAARGVEHRKALFGQPGR